MKQQSKITIHHIIWYVLLFSIAGLIIETIFAYVTMGVIESRKGLVWGPFCPVYGVGATILILLLNQYKQNYIKLFVYGSIIGNIIEYLLSYLLEAMYGTRFWDYAYIAGNLNGRICIKYSLFWGVLAILLIRIVKPWVDTLIDKIPNKKRKIINIVVVTLFLLDVIATVWAINAYQKRVVVQYYQIPKTTLPSLKQKIEETIFSNEMMLKTFPNLRYTDQEGKQHFIRDIIKADG